MTEEQQSWAGKEEKRRGPLIDEGDLEELKMAVKAINANIADLIGAIPTERIVEMAQLVTRQQKILSLDSGSRNLLIGLDYMKAESTQPEDLAKIREVGDLGRDVIEAVLGKPMDQVEESDLAKVIATGGAEVIAAFSAVHRSIQSIYSITPPPQQGRGKK